VTAPFPVVQVEVPSEAMLAERHHRWGKGNPQRSALGQSEQNRNLAQRPENWAGAAEKTRKEESGARQGYRRIILPRHTNSDGKENGADGKKAGKVKEGTIFPGGGGGSGMGDKRGPDGEGEKQTVWPLFLLSLEVQAKFKGKRTQQQL